MPIRTLSEFTAEEQAVQRQRQKAIEDVALNTRSKWGKQGYSDGQLWTKDKADTHDLEDLWDIRDCNLEGIVRRFWVVMPNLAQAYKDTFTAEYVRGFVCGAIQERVVRER